MRRMTILLLLAAICCTPGLQAGDMDYSQSAVLWTQRSAECRALRHQTFALARLRLDMLLTEETQDQRPPAIVVDIDETVLDNSPYQAHLILDHTSYPDGWKEWCEARAAKPLPGALELLDYASSRGVSVYYISNRKINVLEATVDNLRLQGFPDADIEHTLLRDKDSGKESRRLNVAATHRILLLLGDNLSDFSDVFDNQSTETRNGEVENLLAEWGQRFIMLPNPMYGDWEAASYHHDWSGDAASREALRRAALEGWSPAGK